MPGGKRAWNEGRGPGPRQQMSRKNRVTWRPVCHDRGGLICESWGIRAHFLACGGHPLRRQAVAKFQDVTARFPYMF